MTPADEKELAVLLKASQLYKPPANRVLLEEWGKEAGSSCYVRYLSKQHKVTAWIVARLFPRKRDRMWVLEVTDLPARLERMPTLDEHLLCSWSGILGDFEMLDAAKSLADVQLCFLGFGLIEQTKARCDMMAIGALAEILLRMERLDEASSSLRRSLEKA